MSSTVNERIDIDLDELTQQAQMLSQAAADFSSTVAPADEGPSTDASHHCRACGEFVKHVHRVRSSVRGKPGRLVTADPSRPGRTNARRRQTCP